MALCGPLVFVDEAAEDGLAFNPFLGEVGDRVVRLGRAELAAAMGASSVVVGLVLGQDRPQMPLAEDQHPVGDLGPGGEHVWGFRRYPRGLRRPRLRRAWMT